ncbi:hypothetical protein PAXRUDRAFT_17610 [Paxillus rubicundulus Ve08.2h10]|uniref:Uncharacterized protein n=1 Tax=Paxillus rubicundulus Ve08.2h10 TaxID=930991 RepID=A0A0D0D167_9AGAM|nr:hypothetical protein PAXRUDRAFT_17610 [Paxillus rubicundulus Ve08.2h10]
MSSSSEEIDPEKKARKEEEKRKWAEEEAHKKAEAEAEAEAKKKAEEEENRRRAEEERRRGQSEQAEKRKKAPGGTIIWPQEPEQPEVGPSVSRSMGLLGWVAGPQTPCTRCVKQKKKSHMPFWEPRVCGLLKGTSKRMPVDLMSPRGGKDHKRRRQKSPEYQEEEGEGEADKVDEEEDTLGVLVEAMMGFSLQYEEERRLTAEYWEGRAERQGGLDSGIGVDEPKREGSGSRTKTDPKGKAKEVDEDDDMEVVGEKKMTGTRTGMWTEK